jgi:hypothetical protein
MHCNARGDVCPRMNDRGRKTKEGVMLDDAGNRLDIVGSV